MRLLLSAVSAALWLAPTQFAIADQSIAQANGCMACHQVEAKVVGPSYKDVAAKYKGDPGAKSTLIAKVRSGATGTWGQIPMPPNTTISDADLDTVMSWVLSQ